MSDLSPGILRRRRGKAFVYVDPSGRLVRDGTELSRIRALAIPPAYANVWICPLANGHIQATGRDARGRKQYRYHKRWAEARDETKFERMLEFARSLPKVRACVERDLALRNLSREKVLATAVSLLEVTSIRIGNEEYARTNESFGITTLREEHVRVRGAKLRFRFRGKSGKEHSIAVTDRRLARIVQRMQDLPGQDLFSYVDDGGELHSIDSGDVNEYLRSAAEGEFSAKDYRTWIGTVECASALLALAPGESLAERKASLAGALERVALRLGNTPAVCRKAYVHPRLIEAHLDGLLAKFRARRPRKEREVETFLVAFLESARKPKSLERELRRSLRQARARVNRAA